MYECQDLNPGPLQEQPELLTPESSPSPVTDFVLPALCDTAVAGKERGSPSPGSFYRKVDRHTQRLIWMCLESWKLEHPTFSYKWTLRACLEVPAGECSYLYTLDRRPILLYSGKVVLFY